MMKRLKNKKGMTVVELIVAMSLFAILTTTLSAVFVPMLKAYQNANEFAEGNNLLDNVGNQMVNVLLESVDVPKWDNEEPSITIITDSQGKVVYTIDKNEDSSNFGVLLRNGNPVFTKSFYKGRSVDFSVEEKEKDKSYILTISIVSDKDGEVIERDYAVKPIVLNQY